MKTLLCARDGAFYMPSRPFLKQSCEVGITAVPILLMEDLEYRGPRSCSCERIPSGRAGVHDLVVHTTGITLPSAVWLINA